MPFSFFFFQCYGDHRDLHSFPTRRSSDLGLEAFSIAGGDLVDAREELLHAASRLRGDELHRRVGQKLQLEADLLLDRKSTRLNSSDVEISYAVFCLKKKKKTQTDKSTSNI